MNGEKNLQLLLNTLQPIVNKGEYVFCTVIDLSNINFKDVILFFRETEGITIILKKEIADVLQLHYTFTFAWITLSVHSSLEAVGLTAAFSTALANGGISCNVVAAFYHDHIFVNTKDANKAIVILQKLAQYV
jgi:uncharacterized protein